MSIKNKLWYKLELKIAKLFNGKRIAGSGSLWPNKEDAETDDLIIQCKATENKSISVKQQDLLEYEISQELLDKMNVHDNKIAEYVQKAKVLQDEMRNEIEKMQAIAKKGKAVNFKKSDYVIPLNDITLDEAMEFFEGEGIINE